MCAAPDGPHWTTYSANYMAAADRLSVQGLRHAIQLSANTANLCTKRLGDLCKITAVAIGHAAKVATRSLQQ